MKEIESCSHVFASLSSCFQHLETMMLWNNEGDLFPKEEHPPEEILAQSESVNQYCFYGQCLGFQVRIKERFFNVLITYLFLVHLLLRKNHCKVESPV